eukprot:m.165449 g.165449  ORF g.165449 m.165449 type:complete len:393 (-) comp53120_c0_seq3:196-1374(-)
MDEQAAVSQYTCISCRVAFANGDVQREHYRSDWHRYNLKRKIANLAPVSAVAFRDRVLAQRELDTTETKVDPSRSCEICKKKYASENAFQTHLASKKHKDTVASVKPENNQEAEADAPQLHNTQPAGMDVSVATPAAAAVDPASTQPSEEAGTEEAEEAAAGLKITNCIFCPIESESLEANVEHMTVVHSFFVPEIEYLQDLSGLIAYLQEKVGDFHMCLRCNGRGRKFHSLTSVRQHMLEKGHVHLDDSESGTMEVSEYYDFTSSYPDDWEDVDGDGDGEDAGGEIVEISEAQRPINDAWQLAVGGGRAAVHRDLLRYHSQRYAIEDSRESVVIQRVMDQYKSIGLPGYTPGEIEARRDRSFVLRRIDKQRTALSVKANKLQKHYREQLLQ